jgi:hypothetical protein
VLYCDWLSQRIVKQGAGCELNAKLLPTAYNYVYDYKRLYERMPSEPLGVDRHNWYAGIRAQAFFLDFLAAFTGPDG